MRMAAAFLSFSLAFGGLGAAEAADTAPDVAPGADQGADTAPATVVSRADRLNELFKTLKTASDEASGRDTERAIVRLWLDSGSDTVDLLMAWSMKAIDDKDYPLALDFLDRIIALKPDYVEGWNKRATVYYLTDDYNKSLADIAETLALEPRHFGALTGLGAIMREIDQPKKAIEAYREALALDPFLTSVKKSLDELEAKAAGKDA
jgi:tetratricopeptide (TPR) repeat protein